MNLRQSHGRVPVPSGNPDSPWLLIPFPSRAEFDAMYGKRVSAEGRDRYWEMLTKRATGSTLSEAGSSFSLTRERVRQIEMKFLRQMHSAYRKSLASKTD